MNERLETLSDKVRQTIVLLDVFFVFHIMAAIGTIYFVAWLLGYQQ